MDFCTGDFQFSIDEKSPDFLQRGVFSCYEPIEADVGRCCIATIARRRLA